MVDDIRIRIMERMNTRRMMAKKWKTILCLELQKLLEHNMSASFYLLVKQASVEFYEIFD